MKNDSLAQIDLVIEQQFGVKARALSEQQWMSFYAKYRFLKELDVEIQSKVITKGILEAAKIILSEQHNNPMDS